jgi:predicted phage-related endonuclease
VNRLDWLKERQKGISASDAPNLLGIGYGDALSVYRSKIDPPSEREPKTGIMARGLALEPILFQRYAEVMEIDPASLFNTEYMLCKHKERSWQTCSPDRIRSDGRPVQGKTVAGFGDKWGANGTDQIPDNYKVQAQQEMGVMQQEFADVPALDVIAWELRVYRVPFDPTFFTWLTEVEHEFLETHLLPKVPPGPEWYMRFTDEALSRIDKKKQPQLGPEVVELLEKRKLFGEVKKEAEEEYDKINDRLKELMGDAERAVAGPWNLKRIAIAGAHVEFERKPSVRLDVRLTKQKG